MPAYLPHSDEDRARMLAAIGVNSVDDLFCCLPDSLDSQQLLLPPGKTESEVFDLLFSYSQANKPCGPKSFLGAGCYRHHIPAAVRAIVSRAEFATAYTPYQAEASQGTLQQIFEFQTAICELTGLEVANASLWDGPSAAAEAAFLALRQTKREVIVLSEGLHPEVRQVVQTYADGPGFEVRVLALDENTGRTGLPETEFLKDAGVVIIQQPNFFGVIEDVKPFSEVAHQNGALCAVVQNPMTLGVLEAPGRLGADIAVGDVQVFSIPMSYGGPSAGYMATTLANLRQLPGRLVSKTTDADGRVCYTLTLQAREQHIRRAKATSNICSNQALNALAATVYLALLGPHGLRELGEICLKRAHRLCRKLTELPGVSRTYSSPFFNEFTLKLAEPSEHFLARMQDKGFQAGVPLSRWWPERDREILVAVTELNSEEALAAYVEEAAR